MTDLRTPVWFGLTLEETLKVYEDLEVGEHRENFMRDAAVNDLFYLGFRVCGRKDWAHPWIFDRCREVQMAPDGFIDLWAREHNKSSIITGIGLIQEIIRNPDVTIGIFSHTRPIAKGFLRNIKTELETNELLKSLFPDILYSAPHKQSPKWSEDDGLMVRRTTNQREATVEAWGLVDGMPTGKHFALRVYDDVVTDKSVTTPEMIAKTTAAFRLSDNLGKVGGQIRMVGTRYHQFDTYQTIIEEGILTPRIYPATSDGTDDCSKAVLMPPEVLQHKRKTQGPYQFGAQMLLNPTSDRAVGFRREWLKRWDADTTKNLNGVIVVDPASGKKRHLAKNDFTTMWVVWRGSDDNWYVTDVIRDRLLPHERVDRLIELHRSTKTPRLPVFYEETGLSADVQAIEFAQKELNYRFPITGIGTGGISKAVRIQKLIPLFEAGRIYLPHTVTKPDWEGKAVNLMRAFVEEEFMAYPVLAHDDMLDALAMITHPDVEAAVKRPIAEERESFGLNAARAAIRKQYDEICV